MLIPLDRLPFETQLELLNAYITGCHFVREKVHEALFSLTRDPSGSLDTPDAFDPNDQTAHALYDAWSDVDLLERLEWVAQVMPYPTTRLSEALEQIIHLKARLERAYETYLDEMEVAEELQRGKEARALNVN